MLQETQQVTRIQPLHSQTRRWRSERSGGSPKVTELVNSRASRCPESLTPVTSINCKINSLRGRRFQHARKAPSLLESYLSLKSPKSTLEPDVVFRAFCQQTAYCLRPWHSTQTAQKRAWRRAATRSLRGLALVLSGEREYVTGLEQCYWKTEHVVSPNCTRKYSE